MRSTSNTSKALRRARSARPAAVSGSSHTRAIASARAAGSPGSRAARARRRPRLRGRPRRRSPPPARRQPWPRAERCPGLRPGWWRRRTDRADRPARARRDACRADARGRETFGCDQSLELRPAAALADQPDLAVEAPPHEPAGGADERRLVLVRLEARDHADAKARGLVLPAGRAGARGEGGDRHAIMDDGGLPGSRRNVQPPLPGHSGCSRRAPSWRAGRAGSGRGTCTRRRHSSSDNCRHARPPCARPEAGAASHEGVPAERHRQKGVGAITARQPEQCQRETAVTQITAIADAEADPLDAKSVELGRQVVRLRPQDATTVRMPSRCQIRHSSSATRGVPSAARDASTNTTQPPVISVRGQVEVLDFVFTQEHRRPGPLATWYAMNTIAERLEALQKVARLQAPFTQLRRMQFQV